MSVFMKDQTSEERSVRNTKMFFVRALEISISAAIVFALFSFVTSGQELHLDSDGNCMKVVEIPIFGTPMERKCPPEYKLSGKYDIVTPE